MAVVVAAIAVAACGEIEEPEGFAVVTTTTEPADAGGPEPTQPIQEMTTTTEFVPRAPQGYLPAVLVASPSTVLLAGADGTAALPDVFAPLQATVVADDLVRGLVAQTATDGSIVWLQAQDGQPQLVADDAELLDVGYVDGSPFAAVLADEGEIEMIRLVDGERTPLLTLGEDETLLDLSASGWLLAVAVANEQCGDLRFYDAEGVELDLGGPGEPDCVVPRRATYGAVALSPDQGAVAYTVVSYRNDGIEEATELVAVEVSTGETFFERRIGENGDRISAIGFDGDRVVYLRQSPSGPSVTLLELVIDGQETPVDLGGLTTIESVSFARLPLAGAS